MSVGPAAGGAEPTFADVVAGRVRAHVVAQDDAQVAFLAERPLRPGHVIVARRQVTDYLFDLPAAEHASLWAFTQRVAQTLRRQLPCARVCVSVIGWVVRHVHVHLIPTDAPGQLPGCDGPPMPDAELAAIAARLRAPAEAGDQG